MPKKSSITFTKMVRNLEHIGKSPKIKVLHADFKTGEVVVDLSGGPPSSFKDMMTRIKFVEMAERLVVEKADFETGRITVKVLDHNKAEDLTQDEIDDITHGHKVQAMKKVRARTGWSFKDAQKFIEMWESQLPNPRRR